MSAEHLWYIPNQVRPGHRGDDTAEDHNSLDTLTSHAHALERHGFAGALLGTSWGRPDTFTVATALAARTTTFEPLVAIRPGFWRPAHFASAAATLDHLSGGRLRVNIVSGTDGQEAYGDGEADPAHRYARTREFLQIVRRLWTQEEVTYAGQHFSVTRSSLGQRPVVRGDRAHPRIYFGGASEAAERVAAAEADVQLFWGEPLDGIAERIDRLRRLSAELGREHATLEIGLRVTTFVRDTTEEAGPTPRRRSRSSRPGRRSARRGRPATGGGAPPSGSSACSTWPSGARCSTTTCGPPRAGSAAGERVRRGSSAPRRTSRSRCGATRTSA